MNDALMIGCMVVPLALAVGLWIDRLPNLHERGAVVLSSSWVTVSLLILNGWAVSAGHWSYGPAPEVLGMPVPLLIGWVALWGVAAPLAGFKTLPTVAALGAIDIVAMPFLDPAVRLGDHWLIGEALLLVVVAAPAIALARAQATRRRRTLEWRLVGQVALFALALLFVLPGVVLGELTNLVPSVWLLGVVVGLLGAASLPGVIAVIEFHLHGATPWPWDQTTRPIRSGPYRYARSPMQASAFLVLVVLAARHRSSEIAVLAGISLLWSANFSRNEFPKLGALWGTEWFRTAATQRRWIPSLRPHERGEAAVVYMDAACMTCAGLARFVLVRAPIALEVIPASTHTDSLLRIRYERADGVTFDGVRAFGAVLEHLHLGWAMLGWLIRLPLVAPGLQYLGDAVGMGPRPASRPREEMATEEFVPGR